MDRKLDKTKVSDWLIKKGNFNEILSQHEASWSDSDLYIKVDTEKAIGVSLEPQGEVLFWIAKSQYK